MVGSIARRTIRIPTIDILINGISAPDLVQDVKQVTVMQDLESPGMVEIRLKNFDSVTQKLTWSERDLLDLGTAIEVKMGYLNERIGSVIWAEITGLEPEFAQETIPTLVVRGHDLRHRLLYGRKTRSFTNMKDSEIVQKVCQERQLDISVESTVNTLEYVMQRNQTDLEFLQERAQRIGYEVGINHQTLYFRPHQHQTKQSLALTFDLESDLLAFSPRLSLLTQIPEVELRGWDVKEKQAINSRASSGGEALMRGSMSGAKVVQRVAGSARHTIVDQPVQSEAEADQIAQGQFTNRSLAYVTGEGVCLGKPQLQAGQVIMIGNVGKRFSGLYYTTTATHIFTANQGYRTEFTVRRTAT